MLGKLSFDSVSRKQLLLFVGAFALVIGAVVVGATFVLDTNTQKATSILDTNSEKTSVPHETAPASIESVHDGMDGAGTAQNPYIVTDDYELQALNHEPGAAYRLGNNIDASGTSNWSETVTKRLGTYNLESGEVDQYSQIESGYKEISYNSIDGEVTADAENYTVDQDGNITISSLPVEAEEPSPDITTISLRYSVKEEVGFTPIGDVAGTVFTGSLDGDGHTISGIHIDTQRSSRVGLFAESDGTIRDVTVSNADVTGYSSVGILLGSMRGGTVDNTATSGHVQGRRTVGGIAGFVDDASSGTVLTNSNTDATVSAERENAGGLAGYNGGSVTRSSATGTVEGSNTAGGLVGYNAGSVTKSYFTGEVTGTKTVGGITGHGVGQISNAYSTGTVSGTSQVGGVIGYNDEASVTKTYAAGEISGNSSVGGISGRFRTSPQSYWDTERTGQASSAGDTEQTGQASSANFTDIDSDGIDDRTEARGTKRAGGTGLTTAEMQGKSAENNMNLEFESTWQTVESEYPVLQLETETNNSSGSVERNASLIP